MAELEQSFDEHDMRGIPKNSQPDVDHVQPNNDSNPIEKQDDDDIVLGGDETRWPGEGVFRLMVPTQKVGGIIGHEGEFLKKMCEGTGARIKILDGPHGIAKRAVGRGVCKGGA